MSAQQRAVMTVDEADPTQLALRELRAVLAKIQEAIATKGQAGAMSALTSAEVAAGCFVNTHGATLLRALGDPSAA